MGLRMGLWEKNGGRARFLKDIFEASLEKPSISLMLSVVTMEKAFGDSRGSPWSSMGSALLGISHNSQCCHHRLVVLAVERISTLPDFLLVVKDIHSELQ